MKKRFFALNPVWFDGIVLARIIIGFMFFKYGLQLFDEDAMNGYVDWSGSLGFRPGWLWAYLGKATELIGGFCMMLGLFTRIISIPMTINMGVITFMFHKGQPFSGDEHPFLLMLFAFIFFLCGPGKWSLDHWIFVSRKSAKSPHIATILETPKMERLKQGSLNA